MLGNELIKILILLLFQTNKLFAGAVYGYQKGIPHQFWCWTNKISI